MAIPMAPMPPPEERKEYKCDLCGETVFTPSIRTVKDFYMAHYYMHVMEHTMPPEINFTREDLNES